MKKTAEAVSSEIDPSADIRLVGVAAPQIPDIWPEASVLLGPAIQRSRGRYSLETVFSSLLDREMQLWLAINGKILAAATTKICIWPTGLKTARVVLVGGENMEKWTHLMDGIAEWARWRDCQFLEVGGRPGWERVLKWEKTAVELVKDLSDA